MRTTLDLPDTLFRQLKAKAALEGTSLKELLTRYLENGLQQSGPKPPKVAGRSQLPVIPRCGTRSIPNLTPELQANLEAEEDLAKQHRSVGR